MSLVAKCGILLAVHQCGAAIGEIRMRWDDAGLEVDDRRVLLRATRPVTFEPQPLCYLIGSRRREVNLK